MAAPSHTDPPRTGATSALHLHLLTTEMARRAGGLPPDLYALPIKADPTQPAAGPEPQSSPTLAHTPVHA